MPIMPVDKYTPFAPIDLIDRTWPQQTISKAPIWCSVDLRDGNQALIDPMDSERKERLFKALVNMGYKEIEIGFPSASQTDFDFTRLLIEQDMIPDDVTIQVLVQAREELIERTFQSLQGAKNVIVHVYNSTSTTQRRVVFQQDRDGIKKIATDGAGLLLKYADKYQGPNYRYQYSPESFTQTELDFSLDVCNDVLAVFQPSADHRAIINLPSTVEVSTPNCFADQIEWMHRHLAYRDFIDLSVHPHNDRGTAVAAAELSLMAGADRIEGTLFGNGERTGNVDLVTLGMNMVSQGIDAGIDFSNLRALVQLSEHCTQLHVAERHPYAGELVFTAFSGSHQDAIKKGLHAMKSSNSKEWDVPYLPIDPNDVGANYEAIIRINSQSGKGGIAYILQQDFGLDLPRRLQIDFSKIIQKETDKTGKELLPKDIFDIFNRHYMNVNSPYEYQDRKTHHDNDHKHIRHIDADIYYQGNPLTLHAQGSGTMEAYINALCAHSKINAQVMDYQQASLGSGSDVEAVSYVEIQINDKNGHKHMIFGVGRHADVVTSSLLATTSAINRAVAL